MQTLTINALEFSRTLFLVYSRKRGIEFQANRFLEGTVHGSWCTGGPAILGQLIIGGKKGKD